MQVVIPDASVLLKWVLPGQDEESNIQALNLRNAAIRGDLTLKVPSLWIYEIGNTLSRRFPRHCQEMIATLLDFGLQEPAWSDKWLDQAIYMTERYKVTFYDAAYHALALVEDGVFVTADKQYAVKTKRAGSVIALADWQ